MISGGHFVSEAIAAVSIAADSIAAELTKVRRVEALSCLYKEFGDRIYAHAYRMLGNHHDAEDVAQETFLRALKSVDQLRQEERLTSWLYSIASNLCLDHLRRKRRLWWIPLPSDDAGEAEAADGDVPSLVENGDLVRRALRALPAKDALCLVLRTSEGFSASEVAEIMECTESAVWSRLARARAAFSKAYDRMARDVED
jgi:RNA polymerase sigma-70 factor, ECF subfamily